MILTGLSQLSDQDVRRDQRDQVGGVSARGVGVLAGVDAENESSGCSRHRADDTMRAKFVSRPRRSWMTGRRLTVMGLRRDPAVFRQSAVKRRVLFARVRSMRVTKGSAAMYEGIIPTVVSSVTQPSTGVCLAR